VNDRYDYVILGAGVAGLSLAWQLTESALSDRSILLVDGARDDDELRTLSFWSAEPVLLESLVQHAWSSLVVRDADGPKSLPLARERYRTLFFADLQREVKRRLAGAKRHRVVEGRARALVDHGDGVSVTVGDETLRARWAFDSRFRRRELAVDAGRWHSLEQRFRGWIVRTPSDRFDPESATLMDFRTTLPEGTSFCYVLPFSAREALVELVTLTDEDPEPAFEAFLRDTLGLSEYTVLAREAGASPMTEQPFSRRISQSVRAIGIPAGRLKPSTGYALTRILDAHRDVARSLAVLGHPFDHRPDSRFYRVMDAVMLELWEREPARVPKIFQRLFGANDPDLVLRFLDERATTLEVLRMVATLPAGPFVRAAIRWAIRYANALAH
jgi:lycopene beta-cyclase